MKPNFRTPMLGDSQDEWVSYAAGMEEFFPWPDLRHVMSEGKEGSPPKAGSVAFPCIGYYVQRTGWKPEDLYLCFDGGRFAVHRATVEEAQAARQPRGPGDLTAAV